MTTLVRYGSMCAALGAALLLMGQTAPAPGGLHLTATTANVAGAPDTVRIEILRWSTDQERSRLMDAWELKQPAGGGAGGGKGGGKGVGKGAGKGGAKGGVAPLGEAITPEASLTAALQEAPTVGYLWSSEASGYALRYASRSANPDGSQRVLLLTQRRLGAMNQLWNPTSGAANTNEFSAIELRLNAKGEGEGKASVTGKVAADAAARIVALENYAAAPVVFRDVKTKPQGAK